MSDQIKPEPLPEDIAARVKDLMDALDWFHKHDIEVHVFPKIDGWNITIRK